MGRPALFRQPRPGLGDKIFTLLKFRTMTSARDDCGNLLPDHSRVTRLGRLLRRSGIDELPQLWNILTGDLSLVGPRPLLVHYLDLYTPEQRRRHEVKPGLTGWAQIHGRNALSWDEKFALDVWYVDHRSTALDALILLRTVWVILHGRGSAPDGATDEFRGSPPRENP
jgi:lipopolysaccharide/colanic/teichoic acid biosynthesis glycosyltransferase